MSTTSRSSSVSTTQSQTRGYSKSGIGGAGNYHKTCLMLPAGPSPAITPRTTGTFSTSIGGAGNARCLSARPKITVEQREEREEAQRRAAAKHWYHGIGGAGNNTKRGSVEAERSGSNADKLWAGLVGLGRRGSEVISEADSEADSETEELDLKD